MELTTHRNELIQIEISKKGVEEHFSEEAWLGFALGLLPSQQCSRMQLHLAGCADCTHVFRVWSRAAEVAAREALYEPPAHVVDSVKAVFPLVQTLQRLGTPLVCSHTTHSNAPIFFQ